MVLSTTLAKGQNMTAFYLPLASDICLTASVILLPQSFISPFGRSCGFIHNFDQGPKYHAGNLHITFSRKAENITLAKGQNITTFEAHPERPKSLAGGQRVLFAYGKCYLPDGKCYFASAKFYFSRWEKLWFHPQLSYIFMDSPLMKMR